MWNNWRNIDTPLAGLVEATAEVLAALALKVGDERVRDIPSARVVRYYQSTGLIDRPLRYDGRRAIYGFRHLVQIVAIKVLQSESQPLARIQEVLAGRATDDLAHLISVSVGAAKGSPRVRPPRPVPAPPSPASVLRAELVPGVVVYVDPSMVSDPVAVLAALTVAISPRGEP